MKIRIKGNSIRLRLTKTDVATLKKKGKVEEQTVLSPDQVFKYQLLREDASSSIHARFDDRCITVSLPISATATLTDSPEIGVQGWQENGEADSLFLLIEKDLKCLDDTHEDQSDMYENPKEHC